MTCRCLSDDRYIILHLAHMYAYVCRTFHVGSPPAVVLAIVEGLMGSRTMTANKRMAYEAGKIDLGHGRT